MSPLSGLKVLSPSAEEIRSDSTPLISPASSLALVSSDIGSPLPWAEASAAASFAIRLAAIALDSSSAPFNRRFLTPSRDTPRIPLSSFSSCSATANK